MKKNKWIFTILALIFISLGVFTPLSNRQIFATTQQPKTPANSIIAKQYQREQEILEDYMQGQYTFSDPYVLQNPYDINPLTALVMFESKRGTNITVTIKSDHEEDTVQYTHKVESSLAEIPILGLYSGRENLVELKDSKGNVSLVFIDTEPLLDIFPKVDVRVSDPQKMTAGLTLISEFTVGLFAVDTKGEVRWNLNDSEFFGAGTPICELKNGHLAVFGGIGTGLYYRDSVYEIDWLGKVYQEYSLPGGRGHHEICEMPNGNLLIAIGAPDQSTDEDHIVEINRKTGEVVKTIDLKDIIPMSDYIADPVYVEQGIHFMGQSREEAEKASRKDWFHNNSFCYNEKDHSLLVSARSLDAVFKIDYKTEKIVWVLTDPNATWAQSTAIKEKLLTPISVDYEYQYGQHNVSIIPNGDIMLFDNGCYRSKDWSSIIDDRENYSRAVRYRVNEKNLTIEQIWQYGKERGNELLSCYISGVEFLNTDHYLINFGGIVIDSQGYNTSNYSLNGSHEAVIIEIKNGKIVYELNLFGGMYTNVFRVYRVNFID